MDRIVDQRGLAGVRRQRHLHRGGGDGRVVEHIAQLGPEDLQLAELVGQLAGRHGPGVVAESHAGDLGRVDAQLVYGRLHRARAGLQLPVAGPAVLVGVGGRRGAGIGRRPVVVAELGGGLVGRYDDRADELGIELVAEAIVAEIAESGQRAAQAGMHRLLFGRDAQVDARLALLGDIVEVVAALDRERGAYRRHFLDTDQGFGLA